MNAEIAKAIRQMNNPRGKWGNVRIPCDHGHTHDSKKEAARCNELNLLARSGEIINLKHQPRFPLIVNGEKVCVYVADFSYLEKQKCGDHASHVSYVQVIEDAKGKKTREYETKRKLFHACYKIWIRET